MYHEANRLLLGRVTIGRWFEGRRAHLETSRRQVICRVANASKRTAASADADLLARAAISTNHLKRVGVRPSAKRRYAAITLNK
jgi:hypothetical protein